jgi:hypothetical protein
MACLDYDHGDGILAVVRNGEKRVSFLSPGNKFLNRIPYSESRAAFCPFYPDSAKGDGVHGYRRSL